MIFISNEQELLYDKGYCVIYFFAYWIPYHKKMLIMLDKVYDKYPQLNIFAINTTEFKNQNIRFDIKQIPSVLIFKDGLEIKRINGCVLTSAFMSTFNKILGA